MDPLTLLPLPDPVYEILYGTDLVFIIWYVGIDGYIMAILYTCGCHCFRQSDPSRPGQNNSLNSTELLYRFALTKLGKLNVVLHHQ